MNRRRKSSRGDVCVRVSRPIVRAVGPWARPIWLGFGVAAIGVVGLFDTSAARADEGDHFLQPSAATVARAAGRMESLLYTDEPTAPAATPASTNANPSQPEPAAPRAVAFNFKATPWDAVIDFLSRQTGLPVLREASVPNSNVDFISGSSYTVEEALDITNRLLRPHGLQLRRDAEFLLLTKLADAAALAPSYVDRLPAGIGAAEMATVVIPLNNAAAQPTADQIRPLLTPNVGTVNPLPQQNMIVIVDTAANIRRVRDIIDRLDLELPNDSQYRLFAIRHARAADVVEALRGLIAVRQQTVIIDKDGKQRVVEDQQIAGLNLQADPRTNSVIAVGPDSRLRIVEELITLIDRPEGSDAGERTMTTFRLASLSAQDASRNVAKLFENQRPESRPTLLPIDNQGKLTIVGPASQIAQAAALLIEIDPGAEPTTNGEHSEDETAGRASADVRSVLIPLAHVEADAAIRVAQQLISPRVRAVVRFAPAPVGRAIVISGPAADVAVFEAILAGIDNPPASGREVRQVQLSPASARQAADRAIVLFSQTSDAATHPVNSSLDAESGLLTLVGSARGIEAFAAVLTQVERGLSSLRQTRTFELTTATPSGISNRVEAVAQALLRKDAPAGWTPPAVIAVDELAQLIVTATPDELGVIEPLIRSLDRAHASGFGMRLLRVRTADPQSAIESTRQLYESATAALPPSQAGPIDARFDPATGSLILVGAEAAVDRFARLFEQSQQIAAPARTTRLLDVRQVDAAALVEQIQTLLETAGPIDPGRIAPSPTIEVVASSNSLMITAEPAQHELITRFVERLDRLEPADLPPLRLFQLRSSDAESVAQILRRQFDRRPPAERVAKPVDVQADAATNTLVVSAGDEALAQIRTVVDQLNESRSLDADGREIRIFPLRVARAPELARVIDEMYPQPPAPVDIRGRVRPDLQPPREIVVRADPVSNSLIVDAPAARMAEFEQIVRQLDQQQVAGDVELRTYRLRRANIDAAARTLRELAAAKALGASGVSAAAAPVTVATEPVTRTLVISAPTAAFAEIDRVLDELDASADRPATALRLYPLRHARAQRMVGLLDGLLSARLRDIIERDPDLAALPGGTRSLLELAADAPSNTLIISAPPDIQTIAAELIAAFDRPDSAVGRRAVRVVPLTSANAVQTSQAIRGAMAAMDLPSGLRPGEPGAATVEPVPSGNALLISGPENDLNELEAIAASLDIRPKDENSIEVRAVYLKHTRAETITPIVERLVRRDSALDTVPDWARIQLLRDRAFMSGERTSAEVRVAADPGLNAVLLTGPAEMVEVAAQVVASLDVETSRAGEVGRGLRVITIENADASEVAQTVEAILAEDARDATSAAPPIIRVDRASNAIVVRADDTQMGTIAALIAELDGAAAASSRQLRTIRLDRARIDAASLAESVRRISERRGAAAVEVITIDQLLERTARQPGEDAKGDDKPEPPTRDNRSGMHTPNLHPVLTTLITSIFAVTQDNANTHTSDNASGVTIAVDPETNTLILLGPPRQADRIAAIIRELESQFPPEPTRLRVISLGDIADANAVANLVNESVRRIGRASDANPGGSTGPVSVLPDPASQSLLVFSNDTDFELVAQVIAATASPASGAGLTVKVYPLSHTSADRAVAAINDMLSATPRGRQARRILDLTIDQPDGETFRSTIDPSLVRITQSPAGTSLVVTAPPDAIAMIDRLVAVLDQSSAETASAVRLYPLDNADAAAVSRTLTQVFTASRRGLARSGGQAPSFIADPRTNTIVATGADTDLAEAAELIAALDVPAAAGDAVVEIIALSKARPSDVLAVIREVLIGQDPARRERIRLSARDDAGLLVLSAPETELEPVRDLIARLDQVQGDAEQPVRAIKLDRADAEQVARTINDFFDRRNRATGQRGRAAAAASAVSIVGDRRTSTLLISAADADYARILELIEIFDAPAPARDMQVRIVPLANARVGEIRGLLESLVESVRGPQYWWFGGRGGQATDTLDVNYDERTNSVIIVGQGEGFDTMQSLIERLDVPTAPGLARVVRAVRLESANPDAVARALRSATQRGESRVWWMEPSQAVTVEVDRASSTLLLIGSPDDVAAAAQIAADLDASAGHGPRTIEVFPVRFADASRAADTLRRFFSEHARADGSGRTTGPVFGSGVGSVIIVSAPQEDMAIVRDLLAQIDQPEQDAQRRRELFQLSNADARELAAAIREQFPTAGLSPEARVVVTAQPSTNILVVSAPEELFDRVSEMVAQLDAPPTGEDSRLVTVNLASADADELARTLRDALPPNVKVRITPDRRTNALLLTGSEGAITLVIAQIERLDASPARSNVEVRKVPLLNAVSYDVFIALRDVVRDLRVAPGDRPPTITDLRTENALLIRATTEQFAAISPVIEQLDVRPDAGRLTEFVPLRFAEADATSRALSVFYGPTASISTTPGADRVSIIPVPASNSIIISAGEDEWPGIRSLLERLDNDEFAGGRQLQVVPLVHADASSVARAITEAFRAPLDLELERLRASQGRPTTATPAQLGEVVVVRAEPLTNSLIIAASRRDIERIERLVARLDEPGIARLPEARVVPLGPGRRASTVAASIRQLYADLDTGRSGPKSVVIIGDDASGTLIVRADEAEFARIRVLAESIGDQQDRSLPVVRTLVLKDASAVRIADTIRRTFGPGAAARGQTFAVEIDRSRNALVIASSADFFADFLRVVAVLDPGFARARDAQQRSTEAQTPANQDQSAAPAPSATARADRAAAVEAAIEAGIDEAQLGGRSVALAEVNQHTPRRMVDLLGQLGVTSPDAADRPSVVAEAVRITALDSRRAVAIIGSPGDTEAVRRLVELLDGGGVVKPDADDTTQRVVLIPVRTARAAAVAAAFNTLLRTSEQASPTPAAQALSEQVRRLIVQRENVDQSSLGLDLTTPIRITAEPISNTLIVASTPANVSAIRELVPLFDRLPLGEAVVVRFFPLENASATRLAGVVRTLFAEGERLRRLPGSDVRGEPTTQVGRALIGEVAITVDERTNTLIVAGREEGVALVEVLMSELDSGRSSSWIEPRLVQLEHADAVDIAATLRRMLEQGRETSAEAQALRQQVARLRVLDRGGDETQVRAIEADVFASLSTLTILPEENINALIVVASRANADAVAALVRMLDVPAAAADSSVRLFPLKHAAADRVATLITGLFDEQLRSGAIRQNDRVVIRPDLRTNTLVVSTSPRSFAMVERLLTELDGERADPLVGLHVIAVRNADVNQLAPKVQTLMRARIDSARRAGEPASPSDAFSVQAEPAVNALIVAASDENAAMVRDLVAMLTGTGPGAEAIAEALAGSGAFDIIPVPTGRASDVAAAARELYADKANRDRGPGSVTVTADQRLNALLVRGTENDVAAIRDLVQRLTTPDPTAVTEIRRIELTRANAADVVALIENVLAGRPLSGQARIGARQAQLLRFLSTRVGGPDETGKTTQAEISGAIQEQVTLSAELRTNSIVAVAPPAILELIEAIVNDLDTTQAGERRVEVFRLTNADALDMAQLLRELFNLEQQGNRFVLVPGRSDRPRTEDEEARFPGDTGLFPVPDARQQLAITIDSRTNSLLVSATPEYLEEVRKVVAELDAVEANTRDRMVIDLRNARAAQVATTLREYFSAEARVVRETLGPDRAGSLLRLLEQEVTVQGDEQSNSLLVSVSPRYRETVERIVAELDATPPQVLIQVLIAEVTLDDSRTWGLDFNVSPFGGEGYRGGFLAAGAGVATALGVPNLSVGSVDFDLVLRALEEQGRLEVLSRPQILVKDNEPARIQVGENIAIVESVDTFDSGRTQANVTRQDVGIILNVTPSISSDGFVRMDLFPTISSVSARTTQISEGFQAPIITQRQVETVVTVKDGETIIVGGLIQTNNEERRTKVPLLGDIPVIGGAFKSYEYSRRKTELLVILTPKVIPLGREPASVAKLRDITREEIKRATLPQHTDSLLFGDTYRIKDQENADTPAAVENNNNEHNEAPPARTRRYRGPLSIGDER